MVDNKAILAGILAKAEDDDLTFDVGDGQVLTFVRPTYEDRRRVRDKMTRVFTGLKVREIQGGDAEEAIKEKDISFLSDVGSKSEDAYLDMIRTALPDVEDDETASAVLEHFGGVTGDFVAKLRKLFKLQASEEDLPPLS